MSERDPDPERLKRWGLKATWAYLVLIVGGLPSLAYLGAIEMNALELNEIGDFFAGIFGPLAIFWIVLGFLQQGEELRNSVETLRLQASELSNSVAQQKELVQITKLTLEHERNALEEQRLAEERANQANLAVKLRQRAKRGTLSSWSLDISNAGKTISDLNLTLTADNTQLFRRELTVLREGQDQSFDFPEVENLPTDLVDVTIAYRTILGEHRRQIATFSGEVQANGFVGFSLVMKEDIADASFEVDTDTSR